MHGHFKELLTIPSHAEIPEWIELRWPCETLHSLPMIDGWRVREISFAFRKRTSCTEDQVVIEMLNELHCFSVQVDEPLDRGDRQVGGMHSWSPGKEKERQAHNARFSSRLPCCRRSTASTLRRCSNWRYRLCKQHEDRSTATFLVDRLMKWCGWSDGWWNRLLSGKFQSSRWIAMWLLHSITSHTTKSSKQRQRWVSRRC